MEIRQSVRGVPGRAIALALVLLAVLALAWAAWQLVAGTGSNPATHGAPVKTTHADQLYPKPDAPDRTTQLRQPSESPDRVPIHGLLP